MHLPSLLLSLCAPALAQHGPSHPGDGPDVFPLAPEEPAGAAEAGEAPAEESGWDIEADHGHERLWSETLDEGTWLSIDVHPDGDRLVFDLLGDLYVLPLTGGEAERLTVGPAWDQDARWSPDGDRLMFVSDRGGNQEIWIRDVASGELTQVTRGEPERFGEASWHPDGKHIVARKRITDTRSIGMCELWLFDLEGGDGIRLTRTDERPFPTEATFADGEALYFSSTPWRFEYNRDPHGGIFDLHRMDMATGEVRRLTGEAGGAFRPTVNPATGEVAIFNRRGDGSVGVDLFDPLSGARRRLAEGLEHDNQEGFALNGLYPRADWTPDGRELVVWDDGKIFAIDGETGARRAIPFTVDVEHRFAETVRVQRPVAEGERVEAKMIRWPLASPDGETAVFEAFGRLWLQDLTGDAEAVALTGPEESALAPAWSPDGRRIAYASWSDSAQGAIRVVDVRGTRGGRTRTITEIPGQYLAPAWSPDGEHLVWLRGSGATLRGHDTSGELWHVLEIGDPAGREAPREVRTWSPAGRAPVAWSADGERLLLLADESTGKPHTASKLVLKSMDLNGRDEQVVARWSRALQASVSPDGARIAWQEGYRVYSAPLPLAGGQALELKPGGGPVPVMDHGEGAGDWLGWSGDRLSRALGATLWIGDDEHALEASLPRSRGEGRWAYTNARVITMGEAGVLESATVVVDGERIASVSTDPPPPGVPVIDLGGATVMPGLIDVHAHLHYSFSDAQPQRSWRHEVNLAYGVTTLHDPSADNEIVFGAAEKIAAGIWTGPRVFSTGGVLYGAKSRGFTSITSFEDAQMHAARMAAVGAMSVKSYQQPARRQRQWLLQAAREQGLNVYPEGGGDLLANLGMLLDGHTGIEHALPHAPLYADMIGLYAASGAGYTPTLLVAYGGVKGDVYFFQTEDLLADEKLVRFFPEGTLSRTARRRGLYVADGDFFHREAARAAGELAAAGVSVTLGAHGQLQGLGVHWELRALGEGLGAMGALEAATINGAWYLGMEDDIGSVEAGKLADLLVLDADPLADLRNAAAIREVVQGGIRYDGDDLQRLE